MTPTAISLLLFNPLTLSTRWLWTNRKLFCPHNHPSHQLSSFNLTQILEQQWLVLAVTTFSISLHFMVTDTFLKIILWHLLYSTSGAAITRVFTYNQSLLSPFWHLFTWHLHLQLHMEPLSTMCHLHHTFSFPLSLDDSFQSHSQYLSYTMPQFPSSHIHPFSSHLWRQSIWLSQLAVLSDRPTLWLRPVNRQAFLKSCVIQLFPVILSSSKSPALSLQYPSCRLLYSCELSSLSVLSHPWQHLMICQRRLSQCVGVILTVRDSEHTYLHPSLTKYVTYIYHRICFNE
jgi:hypothetical protein